MSSAKPFLSYALCPRIESPALRAGGKSLHGEGCEVYAPDQASQTPGPSRLLSPLAQRHSTGQGCGYEAAGSQELIEVGFHRRLGRDRYAWTSR